MIIKIIIEVVIKDKEFIKIKIIKINMKEIIITRKIITEIIEIIEEEIINNINM